MTARRRDWVADYVEGACDRAGRPVDAAEVVSVVAQEFGVAEITAYRYVAACVRRGSLLRVDRYSLWPSLAPPPPPPRHVRVGASLYVPAGAA